MPDGGFKDEPPIILNGVKNMAGNTRGKIKEHLEGVHRNCDWSLVHLEKTTVLIAEHNPKLTVGVAKLAECVGVVDDLCQAIYAEI